MCIVIMSEEESNFGKVLKLINKEIWEKLKTEISKQLREHNLPLTKEKYEQYKEATNKKESERPKSVKKSNLTEEETPTGTAYFNKLTVEVQKTIQSNPLLESCDVSALCKVLIANGKSDGLFRYGTDEYKDICNLRNIRNNYSHPEGILELPSETMDKIFDDVELVYRRFDWGLTNVKAIRQDTMTQEELKKLLTLWEDDCKKEAGMLCKLFYFRVPHCHPPGIKLIFICGMLKAQVTGCRSQDTLVSFRPRPYVYVDKRISKYAFTPCVHT